MTGSNERERSETNLDFSDEIKMARVIIDSADIPPHISKAIRTVSRSEVGSAYRKAMLESGMPPQVVFELKQAAEEYLQEESIEQKSE